MGTNSGTIADCHSTGWAWGSVRVGGLIGSNTRDGKVIDCHTSGGAVGRADVGGLIGTGEGAVTNSFWDTEAAGLRKSAGGTGKTTAEMDIRSTFTDAGWDFVGENTNGDEDIWTIRKEEYPRLSWELLR